MPSSVMEMAKSTPVYDGINTKDVMLYDAAVPGPSSADIIIQNTP